MGFAKPIAMVLVMLLVVGIAIGLIVGVRDSNSEKFNADSINDLSSSSRTVRTFCEHTDHKKSCANTLAPLSKNNSATPKDYLQLAITVTTAALNGTLDKTNFISRHAKGAEQNDAFNDCKSLLKYAVGELERASWGIAELSVEAILDKEDELKNWISATISYQQSCLDIVDPPLKDPMMHGMQNSSEQASNVLAMVTNLDNIFKTLGVDISSKLKGVTDNSTQRRLLEGGYPGWVSTGVRNLLAANNVGAEANVVVAQDGSGKFKTIGAAMAAYPKNFKGRYIIYVKAGVYKEQIVIYRSMNYVFMYGDGPNETIVTGSLSKAKGTNMWRSATFAAIGNRFICKSMGFQNTAGAEGKQAVALRVQSDRSVFYNCRIDGFQGSLYAQAHRQFYRNCIISGTVDFIFGDSTTIIQNSIIIVRKPMRHQVNTVTAQGKSDAREATGLVIQNCEVVPDKELFPVRFKVGSFLGRPGKAYSTTVVMESTLADFIHPEGWVPWQGDGGGHSKLLFGEYGNRGPGAVTAKRAAMKGFKVIKDRNEAVKWTVGEFLKGNAGWINASSTPFLPGLRY